MTIDLPETLIHPGFLIWWFAWDPPGGMDSGRLHKSDMVHRGRADRATRSWQVTDGRLKPLLSVHVDS